MTLIGNLNNRVINYVEYDTSNNWIEIFPNENWNIVIIANDKNERYFNEIISKSIDKNVVYICSVGKQHDFIHDMADDEIVYRDVDIENLYLPKHHIITVSDEDVEEGIWFGIYSAYTDEVEIKQILILDFTKNTKEKIIKLISKFQAGYLP